VRGVTSALDHVRQTYDRQRAAGVQRRPDRHRGRPYPGHPPETTIELNMRIRNSAVTEFAFTPKRHMLLTYNTLPHLDHADHKDWVSYA
jgi:hypothetical protein